MRVCDGSCRRLARLERGLPAKAGLVRALDQQAGACAAAGRMDWARLMLEAAKVLREASPSCCDADDGGADD